MTDEEIKLVQQMRELKSWREFMQTIYRLGVLPYEELRNVHFTFDDHSSRLHSMWNDICAIEEELRRSL